LTTHRAELKESFTW